MPDLLGVSRLVGSGITNHTQSGIIQLNHTDLTSTAFRYDETLPDEEVDVKHFVKEAESILDELVEVYEQLKECRWAAIKREEGIPD